MTYLIEIIVTLSFFALLIYARLFRKFYDLTLSSEIITEFADLFRTLFYINTIITIVILFTLYKQYKPKDNSIIENIIKIYFSWYFNALDNGLTKVYNFLFNLGIPEYSKYVIDLTRLFIYSRVFRIFLYCGIIVPRLLIVFCLLTEIYLGHLKYFYYSLILLIIPIIIQLIIFMLKDIKSRVFPEFRQHVIVKETKLSKAEEIVVNGNRTNIIYTYMMHPDFPKDDFNAFMVNYYEPLLFIENALHKEFLPTFIKIRLFTLFFYFFFLSVCWGYIFFFIN